ncbi:spore coat protein [Rossellomorea aquimaris]|nr:spore coat protein [Rossellomorea aquimaris]WRP05573.1 spore coat protein [Rossellomorea aquimaris]
MNDSSDKNNPVTNKAVGFLVSEVFRKNGIDVEKVKKSLTDEQKSMLRLLVNDLTAEVNNLNDHHSDNKDPK